MGYRLDIIPKSQFNNYENGIYVPPKTSLFLGKMYGYGFEPEKSKSGKYLHKLGLIDYSESWRDGFYPDFEITPRQCKKFVKLYLKDFHEHWKWRKGEFEEFKKGTKKELKQILSFKENLILNWG